MMKHFIESNPKEDDIKHNYQGRRSYKAPNEVGVKSEPTYFVRAVAPVVHRCRHGHNQRRHAVPDQIEVLPPGVLALKNLHQHDVELHPLQEHPGESCQEEEVQEGSKDGTGNRLVSAVDADEEEELCHEEADAQVLVNRVAVTLQSTEEAEGEDADQEADQ